eukprot:1545429-Pleurochrysis_carterae.AAC.1
MATPASERASGKFSPPATPLERISIRGDRGAGSRVRLDGERAGLAHRVEVGVASGPPAR